MQLASVCSELSEMWNRSCFRMRALLVYATAPRKAGIPNFSTAEMVFEQVRAALLPWNLQQRGLEAKLLLPKENAQQERLDVETVLCLLQEEQNSTNKSTKRSSAVSVL